MGEVPYGVRVRSCDGTQNGLRTIPSNIGRDDLGVGPFLRGRWNAI